MVRKRDRERQKARRVPFKTRRPKILVVSEGEATEPEYLTALARACANPLVTIEILDGQGVPATVVDVAKSLKLKNAKEAMRGNDDNLKYDSIWCVFDIDDHPNVAASKDKAYANELKLAISNPCIELWLLLHFCESPGAQHRDEIKKRLKKYIPDYAKHVNFQRDFACAYPDAVKRAKKIAELANLDGEPGRCPSTDFFLLTEEIVGNNATTALQ